MDNMDILHQHTSKRPLNGEKRHEVGMQLFKSVLVTGDDKPFPR